MAIAEFFNNNEGTLTLTIQPWGDEHQVPHLARAGIRYSPDDAAEDRCCFIANGAAIEFWCNAATYEIEIVRASAFDRLSWDICVTGGWCGGIVAGKPTTVHDLLPQVGEVNAREFAELVMRADDDEVSDNEHLQWLQAKFVQHLGAQSVSAETLQRQAARPFDDAGS